MIPVVAVGAGGVCLLGPVFFKHSLMLRLGVITAHQFFSIRGEKRMAFHWTSLTVGSLVGLPGVHEDRQSAEGFVLEFHGLSKPLSQKARKCPTASASFCCSWE